jgi:hypothetical protein
VGFGDVAAQGSGLYREQTLPFVGFRKATPDQAVHGR